MNNVSMTPKQEADGLTPNTLHAQTTPLAKELSFFVLTLAGFAVMMVLLLMNG